MGRTSIMWVIVRDVIISARNKLDAQLAMRLSKFILTKEAKEVQVLASRALIMVFVLGAIGKWEGPLGVKIAMGERG